MTIFELAPQEFSAWDQYVCNTFPENPTQTSQWPGDFFIVAERDEAGDIVSGVRVDIRNLWLGKQMWWIRQEVRSQKSEVRNKNVDHDFWTYLFSRAERANVVFIRYQSKQSNQITIKQYNHPKFLYHLADPEITLSVDLRFTEEELFRDMHPKSRYNIRLAAKHGVTVNEGSLNEFFALYQTTNARKGLRGYPRTYFEKLLKVSSPLSARILTARIKSPPYEGGAGEVSMNATSEKSGLLASSFLMGFGATCVYLFGGTDNRERHLMAPHLLHWESMRWAKRQGYSWYDFGGISDTNPSWQGITRFKRSFVSSQTGCEIDHGKTLDIITHPRWYSLFTLAKRIIR